MARVMDEAVIGRIYIWQHPVVLRIPMVQRISTLRFSAARVLWAPVWLLIWQKSTFHSK